MIAPRPPPKRSSQQSSQRTRAAFRRNQKSAQQRLPSCVTPQSGDAVHPPLNKSNDHNQNHNHATITISGDHDHAHTFPLTTHKDILSEAQTQRRRRRGTHTHTTRAHVFIADPFDTSFLSTFGSHSSMPHDYSHHISHYSCTCSMCCAVCLHIVEKPLHIGADLDDKFKKLTMGGWVIFCELQMDPSPSVLLLKGHGTNFGDIVETVRCPCPQPSGCGKRLRQGH